MKVVVVGAGYAGTVAANRLAKKVPDAKIVVLNPRADFVERVRLHEQVAGTGVAVTPLAEMLREGIAHRVATVEKIGDGSLTLDDGATEEFDYLFLAVGSTVTPMPGTVPVGTWEGAQEARARLDALPPGAVVTVIGGGLTGVETASEIAAAREDVVVELVASAVVPSLSPGARRRVRHGLERLGVGVIDDAAVAVSPASGAEPTYVQLTSGRALASDLVVWAIVSGIPDLARRSGLAVNAEGRAVVDAFLRSVTDDRIFAVGDCAAVPGARLCCAAATPQGAHAADTLARMAGDRKPTPYSMGYTGQALSLGRKDGLVQASHRDDTVRRIFVSGRVAAMAKERVTRYAKFGSRTAVYFWVPGPR